MGYDSVDLLVCDGGKCIRRGDVFDSFEFCIFLMCLNWVVDVIFVWDMVI